MSERSVAAVIRHGRSALEEKYGHRMSADHRRALYALAGCRTGDLGQLHTHCSDCDHQDRFPKSCGHRACPRCQHHTTTQWLDRQSRKLLPVDYYLVTFTLPAALRGVAMHKPEQVYDSLMHAAADTLKTFAKNHRLTIEIGALSVLHTHSRRLDFHPHVHLVIPGGGLQEGRRQWCALKGRYLFNARNLATVFRAKLLDSFNEKAIALPSGVPKTWIVHCQQAGSGLPALQYLSRYLYRGVIADKAIVDIDDEKQTVTFAYTDGQTGQRAYRSLPMADLLWRICLHVLPTGFRRVREYGFWHHNAKTILQRVQLLLQVRWPTTEIDSRPPQRPALLCPHCKAPMRFVGLIQPLPT